MRENEINNEFDNAVKQIGYEVVDLLYQGDDSYTTALRNAAQKFYTNVADDWINEAEKFVNDSNSYLNVYLLNFSKINF